MKPCALCRIEVDKRDYLCGGCLRSYSKLIDRSVTAIIAWAAARARRLEDARWRQKVPKEYTKSIGRPRGATR